MSVLTRAHTCLFVREDADNPGFAAQLDQQLDRLHCELKQNTYRPQPVRQVSIPKPGKPGEFRQLGIPTIYDRVCQQALLNRMTPIFEPVFDEANFEYRLGRSTKDALRKVWREIQSGRLWIVDADLKDFLDPASYCPRVDEKVGLSLDDFDSQTFAPSLSN